MIDPDRTRNARIRGHRHGHQRRHLIVRDGIENLHKTGRHPGGDHRPKSVSGSSLEHGQFSRRENRLGRLRVGRNAKHRGHTHQLFGYIHFTIAFGTALDVWKNIEF
jgi:hypothetical protein